MSRNWKSLAVCCLVLVGLAAAQPEPSLDKQEAEETTRLIKAELPKWKLWVGENRKAELKPCEKSLLRWTNPGVGRTYGDLYVWTRDGRPEVAMSLFKAWEPANGFHAEMHSLSLTTVEAERDGTVAWQPLKAGLSLQAVPGAPTPASSSARWLSQMRTLAGEFTAELTDYRRNNSGEHQALRLLTQPIYRYQSPKGNLLEGALFAFTLGTDPEVFLLLELHRTKGGQEWQYGLARMNDDAVAVHYKNKEVWRAEPAKQRDHLRDPYVLTRIPESP